MDGAYVLIKDRWILVRGAEVRNVEKKKHNHTLYYTVFLIINHQKKLLIDFVTYLVIQSILL